MLLATDLTELPAAVRQRMHQLLTEENAMQALQAKIRQQRIAQFYHNHTPRSMDGMGGQVMAMDPYWVNYFRWVLGQKWTQDLEARKWVLKKNPCFRVRHGGTKLLFASAAVPGAARRTFKKVYAEGVRSQESGVTVPAALTPDACPLTPHPTVSKPK